MSKEVILTGLRTNAQYHLGNYLGAIKPMVKLQQEHINTHQVNMFAPDLHSFTTPIDHSRLYDQTMANLKVFAAAGMPLQNEDFYIYRQSRIPAHSELTVILNNFAYFGELSRMTQFKDKSASLQHKEVTVGLFDYPVLMASDILLYGAKWVPVGDDQRQHLEFTRDLALRFNHRFGEIFTVPASVKEQLQFAHDQQALRVRSLTRPQAKMSKSDDDPNGVIFLEENPESAAQKISSATTDSLNRIDWDWQNQPGITNLLLIQALLSDEHPDEVTQNWRGKLAYGELKAKVADTVGGFLTDFQANIAKVDEAALNVKIEQSEEAMRNQANRTLEAVQTAVGLRSA